MLTVCRKEQQEAEAGLQKRGSYFLPQIKKELRVFRTQRRTGGTTQLKGLTWCSSADIRTSGTAADAETHV